MVTLLCIIMPLAIVINDWRSYTSVTPLMRTLAASDQRCAELHEEVMKAREKLASWSLNMEARLDARLTKVCDQLDSRAEVAEVKDNPWNKKAEHNKVATGDGSDNQKSSSPDKNVLLMGNSLLKDIHAPGLSTEHFVCNKESVFTTEQAHELLDKQPGDSKLDCIAVQLITNELRDDVASATTKVKEVVEKAKTLAPKVVLSLGPSRKDNEELNLSNERVNAELKCHYYKDEAVLLCDNSNLSNRGTPIDKFYSDDTHLSKLGSSKLAANLKSSICAALGVTRSETQNSDSRRNEQQHSQSRPKKNRHSPGTRKSSPSQDEDSGNSDSDHEAANKPRKDSRREYRYRPRPQRDSSRRRYQQERRYNRDDSDKYRYNRDDSRYARDDSRFDSDDSRYNRDDSRFNYRARPAFSPPRARYR